MRKFIKSNIKFIIGIIIGIIISGTGVYAATIIFQGSQVGFDNSIANLKKQDNSDVETVQEAIDAIYRKVSATCTSSPFHVGDYVNMTPTSTSFTPDATLTGITDYNTFTSSSLSVSGTLNPSYLNVWRVIKVNPDCTVEVVSEYISNASVKFAHKTGYQNYVYYLNEIAKQYANTTYTLDPSTAPDGAFRNVGYDGQTKQITNSTRLDDTSLGTSSGAWYAKTTSLNAAESLGGGDVSFGTDVKLLNDAGVSLVAHIKGSTATTTAAQYWLSSRNYYVTSSAWFFSARYIDYSGDISTKVMWKCISGSFDAEQSNASIRPIVTLKSGLTIASGNGTRSSHYTLSAS